MKPLTFAVFALILIVSVLGGILMQTVVTGLFEAIDYRSLQLPLELSARELTSLVPAHDGFNIIL